jgi:hypothetical protein
MTYLECEKFVAKNKHRIRPNNDDFKFLALTIAANTTNTKRHQQIFEDTAIKGINNDVVLERSNELNSADLNVFLVYQYRVHWRVIPFNEYLEIAISNSI